MRFFHSRISQLFVTEMLPAGGGMIGFQQKYDTVLPLNGIESSVNVDIFAFSKGRIFTMNAQIESFANLKITADGSFLCSSSWVLSDEELNPGGSVLLAAAREWAGTIGAPLKVPTPDGCSWHESEEFAVNSIGFEMLDRRRCRVVFESATVLPDEEPVLIGAYSEERRADGTRFRSGRWKGAEYSLFPTVGQPFEWAGGAFVCESCKIDLLAGEYSLTAREISSLQLGGVAESQDEGIRCFSALWFVAVDALAAFRTAHVDGEAAPWAGAECFQTAMIVKPSGKIGFEVTLAAREIMTRRLSLVRHEKLIEFYSNGTPRRSVSWIALHQVLAGDIASFAGLTGTSAASWAGEGAVVTAVTPEVISAREYRVTVEAQLPGNPGFAEDSEDTELDTREEVRADMSEFFVSAEAAGFMPAPDGSWQPIPCWSATLFCPFVAAAPLSGNLIEAMLRTLTVSVTNYLSGGTAQQLGAMALWNSSRIFNGTVAGLEGSFLKERQYASDVRDSEGALYAKLTRIYRLAPQGFVWNSNYWSNR